MEVRKPAGKRGKLACRQQPTRDCDRGWTLAANLLYCTLLSTLVQDDFKLFSWLLSYQPRKDKAKSA